ncbi:MAG: 2-iminoacetate synthase ThiH [Desulfovibrio sp.]|nr:2-iminoacetate synthase ThiH [Desulfovibrio sp.]
MERFVDVLAEWPRERILACVEAAGPGDVRGALNAELPGPALFAAMLSDAADPLLEEMAQCAHALRLQYFGRSVQLFSPLYVSDHCTNQCRYCGFNARNKLHRRHLSVEEAVEEAGAIAAMGIGHILLLTGDHRRMSPPSYIADIARAIKPDFPSVGVEVYSMTEEEYGGLVEAGVDSMTMFQETYSPDRYEYLHPAGPKRDYAFRLEAPERAARGGMRSLGIGALLGLQEFALDAFATGLHAWWLQKRFPGVEVSVSVPRLRPHEGEFLSPHGVDDRRFVRYIAALRCFLPRVGITCSTREAADMRDHIVPIGVTRVSAGVSTAVGGRRVKGEGVGQFEIADHRGVAQMEEAMGRLGYQTVSKDWESPEATAMAS